MNPTQFWAGSAKKSDSAPLFSGEYNMTRYLLTCPESDFNLLTESDDANLEHLAFAFGGKSEYNETIEFLVRDTRILEPQEYLSRLPSLVKSTHALTWENWERAGKGYSFFLSAHSHVGPAYFSGIDDSHDHRVWPNVLDFCPYYIRMVAGSDGIVVEVISRQDPEWRPLDRIKVVGASGIRWITPKNAGSPLKRERIDRSRHDRTLRLGPGAEKALELIRQAVFGIVGVGGGNSIVAQLLKCFHPKKLILIDTDILEGHNANRFLGYRDGDEGTPKVEIQKREIQSSYPDIEVECISEFFPGERSYDALKEADLILSFPDNDPTRHQTAWFASRYLKPVFDAGTLVSYAKAESAEPQRITARILTQLPEGPCLHCLGVQGGYSSEIEDQVRASQASYSNRADLGPAPQIITTNAFAASLLVRNILTWFYPGLVESIPTYLQFEELVPSIEDLTELFPRNPDCPLCGNHFEAERGWGDEPPFSKSFALPVDEKFPNES